MLKLTDKEIEDIRRALVIAMKLSDQNNDIAFSDRLEAIKAKLETNK